jgi:hypothetical protein
MAQKISLKQAERKVFRTAFQHGLWDVFIGCVVLQFAIAPLLSRSLGDFWSSAVFLPFWALVFVAILLVRNYIVRPRIGLVKFGPYRKRKLTKLVAVMLVVNIIAFILATFLALNYMVSSGWIHMLLLGLIVLLLSTIAAYYLNLTRYFIYGLLFLFSLLIGEWSYVRFRLAHHGFPITFGITSGIIIFTGLIHFFRFLRSCPLPTKQTTSEETVR